jgi:hypothetical protein
MNRFRFDDLARAVAAASDGKTTRRSLLRMLGIGGAASLATSVASGSTRAAFQDAPATPAPLVPVQPPVDIVTTAQKASALLYDIDSIFTYVAEEVRYEPYSGALRGDRGTLWNMAGNSVDQSLLLAALLKEALVDVRFAIGELDDAAAQGLVDGMVLDQQAVIDQDLRAQIANAMLNGTSLLDTPQDALPTTSPDQHVIDEYTALKASHLSAAKSQLEAGIKTITDALATKNVSLPDPAAPALPDREKRQHVWIQYASGSDWIDLDPSMPNAETGKAYTTVTETMTELPAELDHIVRFRIVKEYVGGGTPQRQDVVTLEHRARDLVGMPITFTHTEPSDFQGLGLTIGGLLEGTTNYIPTFFIGPDVLAADQMIQFGTGEGFLDDLDAETSNEGDTLAEWLVTEIVTPDGALEPIERVIFDRVGIEARTEAEATGTPIDVTTIPAIEMIDMGEAGSNYPPMLSLYGLAVVNGQVPSWLFDPNRIGDDVLANISLGEHSYHLVRDRLALELGVARGYRYFADVPNVTAYAIEPINITEGQAPEFSIEADLIHRSMAPLPIKDAAAETHAGIFAGVLAHVAERLSLDSTEWAGDAQSEPLPAAISVGRVFEEAEKQGIATAVLSPESADADLAGLDVASEALARIKTALGGGFIVIVPEKSVLIDNEPFTGWWQVDPVTGATFDRMENGRGAVLLSGMTLFGPFAEYAQLIGNIALRALNALKKLSCIAAVLAIVSGLLFSVAAVQAGLNNSGGLANYAGGLVGSLSGLAGAMAGGGCGAGASELVPSLG